MGTYRENISRESVEHARVQTCLALRNKPNSGPAFISVGNQSTQDGSPAHFGLLRAFPSVGVTENELDLILYGTPQRMTVSVSVDDEGLCAAEEV